MQNVDTGESPQSLHLTSRFTQAVDYARIVHVQTRKKPEVPYLAHLLGVASLVMGEAGHLPFAVSEDMVIGALLHDAVEDAGGRRRLGDIEANFGREVAEIVEGCSDSFEEDHSKKADWQTRKAEYIQRLPNESPRTLLVSLADKLYNARAILEDYREAGSEVWGQFKRGRDKQLWYYEELINVFEAKCGDWRMLKELKRTVAELAQVSAGEPKRSD
jgi:(p)ppGpp synthase/HD superfamily hydrolase